MPLGRVSALRGGAAQRDVPAQAPRSGSGTQSRCPTVKPVLLPLPASCHAALGTLFRPAFPRRAAVRDGERAGARRRRAVGIDQPQMGDSGTHAEPLAAVVARDVCADPVVALETGRVGDGARGGAAADTAASHSRPREKLSVSSASRGFYFRASSSASRLAWLPDITTASN